MAFRHFFQSWLGKWQHKSVRYDKLLVELQARLGAEAFAAAWTAGLALTPEQALAEVLADE